MKAFLLLIRVAVWLLFILPTCWHLTAKGDPIAALIVLLLMGTLTTLATSIPET